MAPAPAPTEPTRALKTQAILGGAPSALEQIRIDQAASSAAQLAAPAPKANPLAACPAGKWSPEQPAPQLALPAVKAPALSPVVGRPGDFLSSTRIAIGKTRFDADWARVSSRHLSAGQVERSMGAPAGDRLALIGQVNRWVNRTIAYRADSLRVHHGDYWADAARTLRSRTGDCEDIAILKYQALLSLGVDPADMYFTLTHDLVRHADHALLVVWHEGQFYLLDDSTDALLDGRTSNDYRPILSFGQGKWLHGLRTPAEPVTYLSRNELSSPRVIGLIK